jgi:hypothetical protein
MEIIIKHVFLCLLYILLLCTSNVKHLCIPVLFNPIVVSISGYYLLLLHPDGLQHYVFHLIERHIPLCSYLYRTVLYFLIFYREPVRFLLAFTSLMFILLWKQTIFLIHHAERRLYKIEYSLYEQVPRKRIAHLHHQMYAEDSGNRFHSHMYHTNRIFLMDSTVDTMGISDSRFKNREIGDIFISKCSKMLYCFIPLLLSMVNMAFLIGHRYSILVVCLLSVEIVTVRCSHITSDCIIDTTHFIGTVVYVIFLECRGSETVSLL